MSKIEMPDVVKALASAAGKRLDDSALPTSLTVGELPAAATVERGSLKGVFGLAAAVEIELFNGNDKDVDGIVGAKPETAPTTVDWHPLLHPTAGAAWLKYTLTASATAQSTLKIGSAAGSINGDRLLRVLCYRQHDSAGAIGAAITQDLGDLPSPLSSADILSLSVQEATALKVRGSLTATLTLSWSDIFSTSLRELARYAGQGHQDTFLISIGAKASATFNVSVEDDFTLCFVRQQASGERAFRVALRKSVRHDARFKAGADVEVAFADPDSVADVLSKVVNGVLRVPDGFVAAIDEAASLEALPQRYRPVVMELAARLGIEHADPLASLKKELSELRERLTAGIDTVAKAKVALGFRYEYQRLSSEASLLEATLSETALRRVHDALLGFDFAKVLADRGPGLAIDFFLHEKTIERVRAWGLSLGIGNWLSLSSSQKRRHLFVTRRYLIDEGELLTRAYTGSTRYHASANSWSTEYGALLKADLELARSPQQADGRDFKCAMQLWWEESRLKLPSELDRIIDDAVLWGVIPTEEAATMRDRLQPLVGQGTCKTRLNVLISDHGLQAAARQLAVSEAQDWGRHAARALPWNARHAARATCESRETVYAPFFEHYSRSRGSDGSALKALIAKSLRSYGGGLAGQESKGDGPWTLYRVLAGSNLEGQHFWTRWDAFGEGASRLASLLEIRGDWMDFDDNFTLMAPVFEQAYLIRTVASLLAERLPKAVHDGRAYAATLTVNYGKDGNESIVIGH